MIYLALMLYNKIKKKKKLIISYQILRNYKKAYRLFIWNKQFMRSNKTVEDLINFSLYLGSGQISRKLEHFSKSTKSSAYNEIQRIMESGEDVIVFRCFEALITRKATTLEHFLYISKI